MMLVEDKHDLQDVGVPVEKLSVEPHSQWEDAAVEQGNSHWMVHYIVDAGHCRILGIHIDQLSEEGELDHQVQPVLMTDLGTVINSLCHELTNTKLKKSMFVHVCSPWPVSSIHMQGRKPVKREETSWNLAEQHHYLLLQKHGPAQQM